jgi:hypothetical protein
MQFFIQEKSKNILKWELVDSFFPWEHQGQFFKPNSAIFYFGLREIYQKIHGAARSALCAGGKFDS